MAWANVKCPHCGAVAKKITVNANVSHTSSRKSCDKCHKPIIVETNGAKVKVYKA